MITISFPQAFNESFLWNQYSNKVSSIWKEGIILWEEIFDRLAVWLIGLLYDANHFSGKSV